MKRNAQSRQVLNDDLLLYWCGDYGHLPGQDDFISEWDYCETAIILSWIIDHRTIQEKKKTDVINNATNVTKRELTVYYFTTYYFTICEDVIGTVTRSVHDK